MKFGNSIAFESVIENTTTPDKVEVKVYENTLNSSVRVFNSFGIELTNNN